MKVVKLTEPYLNEFKNYCRLYEKDHDESFLSESQLNNFDIKDNLTYLLLNEEKIIGVISIMFKKQGRVRIFHVVQTYFITDESLYIAYQQLFMALVSDPIVKDSIPQINLFIPENKETATEIFKKLDFEIERYVYVLKRNSKVANTMNLDGSYVFKPMNVHNEAGIWSDIRNEAFQVLKGFKPTTAQDIKDMYNDADNIPEGNLILWHNDTPVAIIKVSIDNENGEIFGFIGPIAVIPDYQRKGIGRNLLRKIINLSYELGPWKNSLCVNADNENAVKLYLDEGFFKEEVVIAMVHNNHPVQTVNT